MKQGGMSGGRGVFFKCICRLWYRDLFVACDIDGVVLLV